MKITANIAAKGYDFALSLSGVKNDDGFFVGRGPVFRDGTTLGVLRWDGEGFEADAPSLLPSATCDDVEDVYDALTMAVRTQIRTS